MPPIIGASGKIGDHPTSKRRRTGSLVGPERSLGAQYRRRQEIGLTRGFGTLYTGYTARNRDSLTKSTAAYSDQSSTHKKGEVFRLPLRNSVTGNQAARYFMLIIAARSTELAVVICIERFMQCIARVLPRRRTSRHATA